MKLSVIVPVYNEAPTMAKIVGRDPVGRHFSFDRVRRGLYPGNDFGLSGARGRCL